MAILKQVNLPCNYIYGVWHLRKVGCKPFLKEPANKEFFTILGDGNKIRLKCQALHSKRLPISRIAIIKEGIGEFGSILL
jgi:hypothetical protein